MDLGQYMRENHKNAYDIAYEAGISQITVYKILDGRKVTRSTAGAIERATNGKVRSQSIERPKKQKIYDPNNKPGTHSSEISSGKNVEVEGNV